MHFLPEVPCIFFLLLNNDHRMHFVKTICIPAANHLPSSVQPIQSNSHVSKIFSFMVM